MLLPWYIWNHLLATCCIILANISDYQAQNVDTPSSPVLTSSLRSPRNRQSLPKISACSSFGDDTLVKYLDHCSESRTEGELPEQISRCKIESNTVEAVNIKSQKTQHKLCNDSVFSDIDLSYVEKNLQVSTNDAQRSANNREEDCHISKMSASIHSENDAKLNAPIPVTPALKRPSPIAASTPSSNRRKSLSEKMAERWAKWFF